MHDLAEERSLAYHRAVAERLDAALIARARERARAWAESGEPHAPYARAWLQILAQPPDRIAAALIDPSQQGRDLRQASPFAGALDPRERWRIWREVRERWERR